MSISPTLLEALQLAIRAAALTDGAVDPTLGDRLVALGYDRDYAQLEPVAPDAPLRTPEDATGTRAPTWQAIELWTDPPAARLGARTQLDLGATAKALAADRGARAAAHAAGGGVTAGPRRRHRHQRRGPCRRLDGSGHRRSPRHHRRRAARDRPRRRARYLEPPGRGAGVAATSRSTTCSTRAPRRQSGRCGAPPAWPRRTCADANIASTAALVLGDHAPRVAERPRPAGAPGRGRRHGHPQGGWPR